MSRIAHNRAPDRERELKTLSRTLTTSVVAAALVLGTAGLAQAADPNAPATDVAETIAAAAPDAAPVLDSTRSAEAFAAGSGTSTVAVPLDAADPVTITSTDPSVTDLAVTLPNLSGTDDARQAEDGTLVYTSDDDVSLAVQPLADGSTRFLSVLENKSAPERYDYTFDGLILELQDDGSVLVSRDGTSAGIIAPAWARDATGASVATHFEVHGDTLTQVVEHTSRKFEYPITADPWWGLQYKLSSVSANRLSALAYAGGGVAAVTAAVCSGTIVGLPCGGVAGVAAGILAIGGAAISWCNAAGRGININVFWNGWVTCTSR